MFFSVSWRLFSVFSSEELEAFCCHLRCCRFECVLACSSVVFFFKSFSMPSTRPMLYNRSADLLPAPPFTGDSVGVSAVASGPFDFAFKGGGSSDGPCASDQSVPTFVAAFRADSLTARSPAWLFPLLPAVFFFSNVVFPRYFLFQLCIGFHQLTFLSCWYVEFAAFFVSSLTAVSTTPGSYSARLARSIEAPIMASHVLSCLFFTRQKFEPSRASGVMFGLSHEPTPAKLILSGEFVGGNWLTHYVYLYPCS